MAGTTGLEPATSAVTGQRSNQLSYVPKNVLDILAVFTPTPNRADATTRSSLPDTLAWVLLFATRL